MTQSIQPQAAQKPTKAVATMNNISEQVLAKITLLEQQGDLTIPKSYSAANSLKSAWLVLQETKDRNGRGALEVCTKPSIANALFDMVLQGLSVSKKQGYFIVYGSQLLFQRSYFGTIAIAKRTGGIAKEPIANIIYDGDEFVYAIDPDTGETKIVKHTQKLENVDNSKIKGAYAILTRPDGSTSVTIMNWAQIQKSWQQGATKGTSPAHKNFAEEMAKKTVIGRACKMIINSSDDAWLYAGERADAEEARNQAVAEMGNAQEIAELEAVEYEEVETAPATTMDEPSTLRAEAAPEARQDGRKGDEEVPF